MKVSACVIAKNEEKNLAKCLASLKGYADEIIVTDTGSTDGTRQVAAHFGARVYDFAWRDDFSAAKNFTKGKATGEWIVFLDADEYFVNGTACNMKRAIRRYGDSCDGFLLKMLNIDSDARDAPLDEFYNVRMFKNTPEIVFKNRVHEELVNTTGRKNLWMCVPKELLYLHHTGYSSSRIREKCRRNLQFLLGQLTGEQERDQKLYRYLADVYHGLDEYETALKYARLDIATGKKEIAYASRSYRILLHSLEELGRGVAERKEWYEKSVEAFPELPDFYALYAHYLYTLEEYAPALRRLQQAFEKDAAYNDIEVAIFPRDRMAYSLLLGHLYALKDDYAAAEAAYTAVLDADAYSEEAFDSWFRCIRRKKEWKNLLTARYADDAGKAFLSGRLKQLDRTAWTEFFSKEDAAKKNGEKNDEKEWKNIEEEIRFYNRCLLLSFLLADDADKEAYLPADEQRIYDAFCQRGVLRDADFDEYVAVLQGLLRLGAKERVLASYLSVQQSFTAGQVEALADELFAWESYAFAGSVYESLLENVSERDRLFALLEKTAESSYFAGQDAKAKEYFHFLLQEGGTKKRRYEFFLRQMEKAEGAGDENLSVHDCKE